MGKGITRGKRVGLQLIESIRESGKGLRGSRRRKTGHERSSDSVPGMKSKSKKVASDGVERSCGCGYGE